MMTIRNWAMPSHGSILQPILNASQRDAELRRDRRLCHLASERNDLGLLGRRQAALVPIRISQRVPVLGAVKLVLAVRFPFQVTWVDAAIVPLAAIVSRLMLWRRRGAVHHFAH